ncbi:MAG: CRISPR-associated protein Cas5 [Deltaproteobacteria bacterium]|nr:CRISPR-associated protein Cas5 [Deltaproteobacteria bacterium]
MSGAAPRRAYLRARAPFAAYRWLQAGVYRGTSPVMTPSAAYGLLLNLAGVESRAALDTPVTQTRPGLPALRLAVGAVQPAGLSSLYQQLHGYPVGNSSKALQERARGAKYHIAPVRRELLVDLDVVIAVEGDPALLDAVGAGLSGAAPRAYGLPFAGDNNLLFDELRLSDAPTPARWYARLAAGGRAAGSARLTVHIDRADSGRTQAPLFAPVDPPAAEPPAEAWVQLPAA